MKLYLEDELANTAREYAKIKRQAEKTNDPKLMEKSKALFKKIKIFCKKLGYWD